MFFGRHEGNTDIQTPNDGDRLGRKSLPEMLQVYVVPSLYSLRTNLFSFCSRPLLPSSRVRMASAPLFLGMQLFPYASAQFITLGKSSRPTQLLNRPPESHCHIAKHVMACLSTLLLLSPSVCELEEDRTAISLCPPPPVLAGARTKGFPGIC